MLGLEDPLAALTFARLFEITNRVKEGEQVGRLIRADLGKRNALVAHRFPHGGSVVTHAAGDARGCVVSIQAPAQIRSLPRALTSNGVAVHAHLGTKELRTAPSIRY